MSEIVLLHGVPTTSALWDDVVDDLEHRGHRCTTPTLPGYGDSPPLPLHQLTVDHHLAWLEPRLPAGRLHLVGQDYGGLLCAEWAARHPLKVASVTLISAVVGLGWTTAWLGALPGPHLLFYRAFAGRLYHHQGVAPHRRAAFAGALSSTLEDPALSERMRRTALSFSFRQLATLPRRLGRTTVPLHALWGAADRFAPGPIATAIARRHARLGGAPTRVTLVPGGRHYLPFDQPQQTAEAIDGFIAELSYGTVR